jgi:hypothetical protein
VIELGRLLGHGEAEPSASAGPAALQGRALEGACDNGWVFDKDNKTRTSRLASGSSFTWAVALHFEIKHMEKGKIELPLDDFFHLRDGLAAGALLGWPGWTALPKRYEFFELSILAASMAAPSH